MNPSDDTRKAPRKIGEDTPSEESLLVDGAVEFFEALLRHEGKSGMLPGTWIDLDAAGIGQPPQKERELLREMGMVQYLRHSRGVHARIPADNQWREFGNKVHRFEMQNFAPEFLRNQWPAFCEKLAVAAPEDVMHLVRESMVFYDQMMRMALWGLDSLKVPVSHAVGTTFVLGASYQTQGIPETLSTPPEPVLEFLARIGLIIVDTLRWDGSRIKTTLVFVKRALQRSSAEVAMLETAPWFLSVRQKTDHAITEESTDNAEQSHKPEEHQSGKASHVVKENHIVQTSQDDEAPHSVKSTHNLGAPQQEQARHHLPENQTAQSNQKPREHQHNQWAKDVSENQSTEAIHQRSENQTNRGRQLVKEIQSAQSGQVVQESQVTVAGQHSQEHHSVEASQLARGSQAARTGQEKEENQVDEVSHPDKEIQKNKTSKLGDWKRCADELADALEEVCSHIPEAEDHAQFSALQRSVFPALKALNRLRKLKAREQ